MRKLKELNELNEFLRNFYNVRFISNSELETTLNNLSHDVCINLKDKCDVSYSYDSYKKQLYFYFHLGECLPGKLIYNAGTIFNKVEKLSYNTAVKYFTNKVYDQFLNYRNANYFKR